MLVGRCHVHVEDVGGGTRRCEEVACLPLLVTRNIHCAEKTISDFQFNLDFVDQ